jgi:hypothetical protein
MHMEMPRQITINAPAQKVWRVVAHEFEQIGRWATVIPHSHAVTDGAAPEGAHVCGRVCGASLPGVSAVQERFVYYDEQGMRFGYEATAGLPGFITRAQNHWSVRALTPDTSLVAARGELEVRPLPGLLLLPLLQLQLGRTADQLFEELRYYVEHNQPHPRKLRALQKQARKAAAHG